MTRPDVWLRLLQCCVSVTLFSRGWLTWKWDSPIRGLLWNEGWWSSFVDWETYALESDPAITTGLQILGIVLLLGAVVPWLKQLRALLVPLFLILLLDSFARFADSGYTIGMAIEHSLQWSCPLLLLAAWKDPLPAPRWILAASIATALTFVGHGLYAVGFHPVPLKYLTMTSTLVGLEGAAAKTCLAIFGYLDFAVAVAIFIRPIRSAALLYMVAWGGLTALARVASGPTLDPWLIETLVRTSHWLVPLILFLLLRRKQTGSSQ